MKKVGRRDFTRNVALATLFSPFVSVLAGRPEARAAAGKAKYLLVIMSNGTDMNHWPSKGSSPTAIKFSNMMAPLAPIQGNLILADTLDSRGTASGHAAPGALSGKSYGAAKVSIDQFVAQKLIEAGLTVQIPSLVLGGTSTGAHKVFFRDAKEVTPIYSATSAFETVFAGATGPVTPGAGVDKLARRQSILDTLRGDLKQLSAALGTQERAKLDLYSDSIRQLEERIKQQTTPGGDGSSGGGGQCGAPTSPAAGAQDVINSALHLDIVANAFACDLTRVAAVAFGHDQNCQVDLPQEVGAPGDWHSNFTHGDAGERTRMQNLERWICGEIVGLCDKLKSMQAPTGGGTLFDQTLIMWARDMGDAVVHNGTNMPFMFAGGAGGYLRKSPGGVYVNGGGEFHQRALLNCAEAMGITDFTGFGETNAGGDSRLPLPAIGG